MCDSPVISNSIHRSYSSRTSSNTPSLKSVLAIGDSGSTDFFVRQSDSHILHSVSWQPGIDCNFNNKTSVRAIGYGYIDFAPLSDIKCYIFTDRDMERTLFSLSTLCARGCICTLTSESLTITFNGTTIIYGPKDRAASLWTVDLSNPLGGTAPSAPYSFLQTSSYCHTVVRHDSDADFVKFLHASFGSPPSSSFLNAIRRKFISHRRLTSKMVAGNLPNSIATAFGHLDQTRQGQHSTRSPVVSAPSSDDDYDSDSDSEPDKPIVASVYVRIMSSSDCNHSDLTGRFPIKSARGNQYILVSVCDGYVHYEPMMSKSASCYVAAYRRMYSFFAAHGRLIRFQKLDNETSTLLETYLASIPIHLEYVSPGTHRTNKAERAIRAGKNHIIATFATAHPDFDLSKWDEALEQCEITINHLRSYGPDRRLCAYEGFLGQRFDFDAHPIAPFGTLVVAHDKPAARDTWAPHGVKGFYLGPAMRHYRAWRVWIIETRAERVCDTLAWFPKELHMPGSSDIELLTAAITDLHNALDRISRKNLISAAARQPFDTRASTAVQALRDVADLFAPQSVTSRLDAPVEVVQPPLAAEQRVSVPADIPPPSLPHLDPDRCIGKHEVSTIVSHRGNISQRGSLQFQVQYLHYTNPLWRKWSQVKHLRALREYVEARRPLHTLLLHLATPTALEVLLPPTAPVVPPATALHVARTTRRRGRSRRMPMSASFRSRQAFCAHAAQCVADVDDLLAPSDFLAWAHAALNLTIDGRPLTYRLAKQGPDVESWEEAEAAELRKLLDTGTIRPTHLRLIPADRRGDITYYNPQVREKEKDGIRVRRVRGTAGGDRISYPGAVSARTADMELVNMLLQSVLHDDAEWMTIDITDFYLNTPLERPEYLRIQLRSIPLSIRDQYSLTPFISKDSIIFEVNKGMYGLPQAGLLAQERLITHLASAGYHQDTFVPCLFTHVSNGVQFTLVVDDFGIKYKHKSGAEHLIATLQALYPITVDWSGDKYLGRTITFNRALPVPTVHVALPGYIAKALERFRPGNTSSAASPSIYVPPKYGAHNHWIDDTDASSPLTTVERKYVQEVLGVFLYYARSADYTMLPTVTALASEQSSASRSILKDIERLLDYACRYPNNGITFKKSDMTLIVWVDGSYLSRSRSRSVAGAIGYLGSLKCPHVLNGGSFAFSSIIDVVVASAAECEYGSLFMAIKHATWSRAILTALGHPQPPTPVFCDNRCAIGLANDSIKIRRSKSIDMRFHWIRDRISQSQFKVSWVPTDANIADFFTKALPVQKHKAFIRKLATILTRSP